MELLAQLFRFCIQRSGLLHGGAVFMGVTTCQAKQGNRHGHNGPIHPKKIHVHERKLRLAARVFVLEMIGLGNRVVTACAPRVTAAHPPHCQPRSFPCAPRFDRFYGVTAARRVVPAIGTQPRTEKRLVTPHEQDQQTLHHGTLSNAITKDKNVAPPHKNNCWSRAETLQARSKLAVANMSATMMS